MFTGIVQDVGRLAGASQRGPGRRLAVETRLDTATFELGESVAVNGVCLTVAAFAPGRFEADASPETLRRSNLGELRSGDPVNLERALRPVDRLGGHFVLGHVDAVGRLEAKRREGAFWVLRFGAPPGVLRYLVEKGSVAVDGISLTVSGLDSAGFTVAVIPHTLERTTLADRPVGARVNLEADILGKYVERLLGASAGAGGMTLETLARSGFLK
ncbi:MAG: riboflavin synthase [Deferrisomatales bacterium]